jgi:hypothetical protein
MGWPNLKEKKNVSLFVCLCVCIASPDLFPWMTKNADILLNVGSKKEVHTPGGIDHIFHVELFMVI